MAPFLAALYTDPQTGEQSRFEYFNTDSFDYLDLEQVRQIYGVCFYRGKMVVVKAELTWILPGGTREPGESVETALKREIKEETNMEVLIWQPIGVQTVFQAGKPPFFQLRVFCQVRPYGPFISDPDGDVTAVKLIDPKDYRRYFDWGEIGEEIIKKAISLQLLGCRHKPGR